jgi:hypothetical protein
MLERSVSEDSFKVRNLPAQSAYQCTDENNEIAFRFAPVHCTVDESDGSFTIHTDHKDQWGWQMQVKQYVVRTGNIDGKGKYTFTEKDNWAKNHAYIATQDDDADKKYYDYPMYFRNDIMHKIKQRKLYISV